MVPKVELGERPGVGAVIVAAGSSRRMGGQDKLTALLGGRMVLARVVDVFESCRLIERIVIVLGASNLEWGRRLVVEQGWSKVSGVCAGGKCRQDSVAAGLSHLAGCCWVVIHDGARPLLTEDLISRGLVAAGETGAAVAAVPVSDTIKLAEGGFVCETLPRDKLWAVQTPQVFRVDIINEACRRADGEVTDDASLVERMGCPVKLYSGSYDNIKITTPGDLALAEVLVKKYGG
ncbi:MAG: 2-C-methyl-D-erythritol 4-phosphate cytidylyltransferase [Dehalococcoidales bacterium]|nr:2-C-methyl-D-erythritol 4-phosphate cytidylyltransferase [Dehalococcoidales bacterium]